MSKVLLAAMAVLLGCGSANATPGDDGGKTVYTFYGTKARNSAINPCKGVTRDKCGTVTVSKYSNADNTMLVVKVARDNEGTILATDSYITSADEGGYQQLVDENQKPEPVDNGFGGGYNGDDTENP